MAGIEKSSPEGAPTTIIGKSPVHDRRSRRFAATVSDASPHADSGTVQSKELLAD
jgi:hypothetical protein